MNQIFGPVGELLPMLFKPHWTKSLVHTFQYLKPSTSKFFSNLQVVSHITIFFNATRFVDLYWKSVVKQNEEKYVSEGQEYRYGNIKN